MHHYRTREMREHDETAWAALVFGATDLRDDPLPDEPDTAECWHCEAEFTPDDASGGLPGGYDLCPVCMRRLPEDW
jgi:hypothetical protein